MERQPVNIFWFRRDLRLKDNAGLYHALRSGRSVLPVFIFDRNILDKLPSRQDARVEFIHQQLQALDTRLKEWGSSLLVMQGTPGDCFGKLTSQFAVEGVFCNRDYEPYARERDQAIETQLKKASVAFYSYKDQVIFDRDEVLKDDGRPYTVFTPYSRKWKGLLNDFYLKSYPVEKYRRNFYAFPAPAIPALDSLGFQPSGLRFPAASVRDKLIGAYDQWRDIPSAEGTSRLGVHLRFGTISIRELARKARQLNETFLNELIWREFYQMILWHFPHVGQGKAFRPEYDQINWKNNEAEFEKWCRGETGYPIVDAGMRELDQTGYMHNRVRMIVASFLSKHLLIDWRWGEAYFAEKLLDFDLASNNGGWQWAAGSGCDAAPYFRIFNPYLQTKKFDPDLKYIRQWVPELDSLTYPRPMVEHESARKRCLETYGAVLKQK